MAEAPPEVVFLAARNLGDEGVELLYRAGDHSFSHVVRRTVIGVGFPTATDYGQSSYAYLCVAAERCWYGEDDSTLPERQYIIIEEAEATITSSIYQHAVRLKDTYLASMVFCPNDPVALVDGLKRVEGLSHYPDEPPQMLRERFPTFVSTIHRAGVRDVKVDIEEARKDINRMLDEELRHPGTDLPIFGPATGTNAQRRLITLTSGVNFKTDLADQAIQRSEPKYIVPVWLAVNGLERSMVWKGRSAKKAHEWQGSANSGY